MNKSLALIGIVFWAVTFANGQTNPPDPTPTPYLGRSETSLERIRRLDRAHDRIAQQTYSNLYGQGAYAKNSRYSPEWRARMVALYREPKEKETADLKPDERHFANYLEFLEAEKTGLVKLIPDLGCPETAKVVDVSPRCRKYDFPGSGSSYSFRLESYRIRRLADVTFAKNSLVARGVFNGAIFLELGDIPIEDVSLKTSGMRFLLEYKPVKNAKEALAAAKRFARGVEEDGYIYGRGVYVTSSNTFAMRSIAYRGKYRRLENGVAYNELDFDRRRDIIVVFRILDVEDDGSATIVWKVLRETKSPKLKVRRKAR